MQIVEAHYIKINQKMIVRRNVTFSR